MFSYSIIQKRECKTTLWVTFYIKIIAKIIENIKKEAYYASFLSLILLKGLKLKLF